MQIRWLILYNSISCHMKFAQSCLTVYNAIDYTVHGILQAKTLEYWSG